MNIKPSLVFLTIAFLIAIVTAQTTVSRLKLIDTKRFPKALCLDGSAGGRYQLLNNNTAYAHTVFFHIEGGAWASTPASAYSRSKTALGSSTLWDPTLDMSRLGVVAPTDKNVEFQHMNHHYLKYCDGMSFGGTKTVDYQGNSVYMYGDYIMRAHLTEMFEQVRDNMKAVQSTQRPQVVVSGCSAGGLASLANTWKVEQMAKSILGNNVIVSTIPCSGVFPDTASIEGNTVYPNWMRQGYELAKPLYSPSDDIVNPCFSKFQNEPWKCMFGENHIKTIQTPIFVINSVIDSWSMTCIFGSRAPNLTCGAIPEWQQCVKDGPANCTATQINTLKQNWIPLLLKDAGIESNNKAHLDEFLRHDVIDDNGAVKPYYDLATDSANEKNNAMFSYIDPDTNRIHIEPVTSDIELITRQMTKNGGIMTKDAIDSLRKLKRFTTTMPNTNNPYTLGFSLPALSGAFLHTCHTHCEGSNANAFTYKIDNVTIVEAVNKWYKQRVAVAMNDDGNNLNQYNPFESKSINSTPHVYLPCAMNSATGTGQCNPTCGIH